MRLNETPVFLSALAEPGILETSLAFKEDSNEDSRAIVWDVVCPQGFMCWRAGSQCGGGEVDSLFKNWVLMGGFWGH
jgi:hypothetical protein